MLTKFDWLRRCETGAELLSLLDQFEKEPNKNPSKEILGGPYSAIGNLCHRCKIYKSASINEKTYRFCHSCLKILLSKKKYSTMSQHAIILWGFISRIPEYLKKRNSSRYFYGSYLYDDQRFLAAMHQKYLREWLQGLILYCGYQTNGLIQIFPSLGELRNLNMGDYLTWAIHHEATLSMDQLRVRFYTSAHQLIDPSKRDRHGLLTFYLPEFISMLEMAEIFRANLLPDQQKSLYKLLLIENSSEEQFLWGRFLGQISQKAKDMLSSWNIRQWNKQQIKFFFQLIKYAILPKSN